MDGVLISVNPFILGQIPFERTERAVKISREVFGANAIVYQETFYRQFRKLKINGTLPFEQYLRKEPSGLAYTELLPMGRAVESLAYLYKKYPAKQFFGKSCEEELTRGWHVHIDNYCNYMRGYCAGISLGDGRELGSLCRGIDLNERPILEALVTDLSRLLEFAVTKFDYKERLQGYVSKCHLCIDVRRYIAQQTDEFEELRPRELYYHIG